MKTKEEYLDILRKYLDLKSKVYGIVKIGIFGSVARNEQTEDSDVDVCVEMQKPDMFSLVHIKEDLQHLFGRPVDIVRLRDNMNPMLSKQIQRDGIYVWWRIWSCEEQASGNVENDKQNVGRDLIKK